VFAVAIGFGILPGDPGLRALNSASPDCSRCGDLCVRVHAVRLRTARATGGRFGERRVLATGIWTAGSTLGRTHPQLLLLRGIARGSAMFTVAAMSLLLRWSTQIGAVRRPQPVRVPASGIPARVGGALVTGARTVLRLRRDTRGRGRD
jgi:hypothetical protein